MKVIINNREYNIRLRARAWPSLRLLGECLGANGTVDNEQLDEAEEKILRLCVDREVHPDDRDELIVKILGYFARLMSSEFQSFRSPIPAESR